MGCSLTKLNHFPQAADETRHPLLGRAHIDARYQFGRRLGQGGMGVVFKLATSFSKPSRIKVILPDLVGNDPIAGHAIAGSAGGRGSIRHQKLSGKKTLAWCVAPMPFWCRNCLTGQITAGDILASEKVMARSGPRVA